MSGFCEPWVEKALLGRLLAYKAKYPRFKHERVMDQVSTWPAALQKAAPYMSDKQLKGVVNGIRKSKSLKSLSENEHA